MPIGVQLRFQDVETFMMLLTGGKDPIHILLLYEVNNLQETGRNDNNNAAIHGQDGWPEGTIGRR